MDAAPGPGLDLADFQQYAEKANWAHVSLACGKERVQLQLTSSASGSFAAGGSLKIFSSEEEVPLVPQPLRAEECPWDKENTVYDQYSRPHLVYVPVSIPSDKQAFAQLHKRCLEQNIALLADACSGTLNLDVEVLLVPREEPGSSAASRQQQQAGGPSTSSGTQAAAPKVRRVFYAYFAGRSTHADNPRSSKQPLNNWLERRLKPQRGTTRDALLAAWQAERQEVPRSPWTGMPAQEEKVTFCALTPQSAGDKSCNVAEVASVPPGTRLKYIMMPVRQESVAGSEKYVYLRPHKQPEFLAPCACDKDACGGQAARLAVKQIRENGCQYSLRVKHTNTERGLGLYANESIPEGAFIFEYLGEYIDEAEAKKREVEYDANGGGHMHYMMILALKCSTSTKKKNQEQKVEQLTVDATRVANASRFMNHSCAGSSACIVNVCQGGVDDPTMIPVVQALRDIEPGEEVTINYHPEWTTADVESWKRDGKVSVPCRCGASECLGWLWKDSGRRTAGIKRGAAKALASTCVQGAASVLLRAASTTGASPPLAAPAQATSPGLSMRADLHGGPSMPAPVNDRAASSGGRSGSIPVGVDHRQPTDDMAAVGSGCSAPGPHAEGAQDVAMYGDLYEEASTNDMPSPSASEDLGGPAGQATSLRCAGAAPPSAPTGVHSADGLLNGRKRMRDEEMASWQDPHD